MKKDTVSDLSGRRVTVNVYDTRTKELLEYVRRLDLPWREYEKLEAAIAGLREGLVGRLPFIGLVVTTPPPKQNGPMNGLGIGYAEHGQEFCDWFNNLQQVEMREAEQGTTAYRLTKIMPFCKTEKVTRYKEWSSGWLSRKEEQRAIKNGDLRVCPKCRNCHFTKVIASSDIKSAEKVVGVTHECKCGGCNRQWVEENVWSTDSDKKGKAIK